MADDQDDQAEFWAILAAASLAITKLMNDAYKKLTADIRAGKTAREAVQAAMETIQKQYAEVLGKGLKDISGPIGDVLAYEVGQIKLSSRLYAQTEKTSSIVEGVVRKHARGLQDSRALAIELFDGYEIGKTEILEIRPTNQTLPKHLRDLLKDNQVNRDMAKAYSKAQTLALKTGALKAARTELLKAIDDIDNGSAAKFLDKKLKVAFNEKVRYFANRIAQTELQRAYAERQAREYMLDDEIEYLQWRLSPTHPVEDICDYFAQVNKYGLGPGVYPKALAPTAPAHPFCKCVLSPRLDLNGKTPKLREDADQSYFNRLSNKKARIIAGSAKKLERVKAGETAWDVHNSRIDPIYQVKPAGSI